MEEQCRFWGPLSFGSTHDETSVARGIVEILPIVYRSRQGSRTPKILRNLDYQTQRLSRPCQISRMPRVTRLAYIVGLTIGILPLVIAIIYKQQSFLHEEVTLERLAPEENIDTSVPSLFSMADIHGDYPRALAALVHAGVVNENGDWKAGNSTFV